MWKERKKERKKEEEERKKNNAKFSGRYVCPRTQNVRAHVLRSHQFIQYALLTTATKLIVISCVLKLGEIQETDKEKETMSLYSPHMFAPLACLCQTVVRWFYI